MRNIIITPKGEIKSYEPANGKTFTLKELQQAVEGYIEVYPSTDRKQLFVMNEEGFLKGLPLNVLASEIFNASTAHTEAGLVGSVLLIDASTME